MDFKHLQTQQKLRGGYYTPARLAEFLVRWLSPIKPQRILEPSCGDGEFFGHIARILDNPAVQAFEIDPKEAKAARQRAEETGLWDINVLPEDFLGWAAPRLKQKRPRFDAIVGNPPFIRYQFLPPNFQERAEQIFDELDCKFTKHTNAWVPFVLASFALLRPGGRLAMVVPAEIIHVMHAQSLRSYLGANCSRMLVIDPEEIWFGDTLQGAVLLLAEKRASTKKKAEGVGIYPVRGNEFLSLDPEALFQNQETINGKTVAGKWTRALLDVHMRDLLDDLAAREEFARFEELADVDVGIVTGANKFFLVEDDVVERYGLERFAHPMFGRSEHCPGVLYDDAQHAANKKRGNPTNFIWFDKELSPKDRRALEYVRLGEEQQLHTRFKCRTRRIWYSVPSVYSTEIGMLKRAHDAPRLILNKVGAYTTDTAYRIRIKEGRAEQLVFSFVNSLTALSSELEGRHYGGGVLELVPSEIERLLLPRPGLLARPALTKLDKAIRTMPFDDMLAVQSKDVLGRAGLTSSEQNSLLAGWKKLRDRRHRVSSDDVAT